MGLNGRKKIDRPSSNGGADSMGRLAQFCSYILWTSIKVTECEHRRGEVWRCWRVSEDYRGKEWWLCLNTRLTFLNWHPWKLFEAGIMEVMCEGNFELPVWIWELWVYYKKWIVVHILPFTFISHFAFTKVFQHREKLNIVVSMLRWENLCFCDILVRWLCSWYK